MAWLKRMKSGLWHVRWTDEANVLQQRTTRTRDKATAERILREMEKKIALERAGIVDQPVRLSLAVAWQKFIDERHSDWDEKTRKLYNWAGKRLLVAAGDIALAEISGEMIDGQVTEWRDSEELSDTSTVIWVRHVRSFLNHSAKKKRCEKIEIRTPSVRDQAERVRVFKTEELQKFFAACDDLEARTLFEVMLLTGARLEHSCELTYDDINEHDQLLYFRAAHGKRGKRYEIELFPTLLAVLQKHGQNRAQTGRLWRFGHWRARKLFEVARDAAGLSTKLTPHCLRHTAAAGWLARGVPLKEVSRLLGHSNVGVTEKHYAHFQRGSQTRYLIQSDVADLIQNGTAEA